MRRRCPISRFLTCRLFPLAVVRRVATVPSGGAPDGTAPQGRRTEIDALLREVRHLQVRRGRGEPKLCVSASKLRLGSAASARNKGSDQPHAASVFRSGSERSPPAPVVIKDPPVFTDIACTLQELEHELFRLTATDAAVDESKHGTGCDVVGARTEPHSPGTDSATLSGESVGEERPKISNSSWADSAAASCESDVVGHRESLVCWSDADANVVGSGSFDSGSLLEVSALSERTFIVELREQPRSVSAIIAAVNQALTKVESLKGLSGGLVVVFRSLPGIDFFTPLHSELEMTFISRVELLRSKERLFWRMRRATLSGVVFKAELNSSAFDFGAELFFLCEGQVSLSPYASKLIRVGFPSVSLGVWPAPHVLQRMCVMVGNTVDVVVAVPTMHKLTLRELLEKHPSFFQSSHNSQWVLDRVHRFLLQQWKNLHSFLGWDARPCVREWEGDVLMTCWADYCALVGFADDNNSTSATSAVRSLNMYLALLETSDFRHVASVTAVLRRMQHRVLSLPPQEEIVEICSADVGDFVVDKCFPVFLDGSSPATVRFIAKQRTLRDANTATSALLMGDVEGVKGAAELLDCAVVATPFRPEKLRTLDEGDVMEVRLLDSPHRSRNERTKALSSALAYLQSKGVPYIVTRGDAGNRLVAALSLELCRLARGAEVGLIELVAKKFLRFRISPFQLLDHYGSASIAGTIQRYPHLMNENQVASTTCLLLSAISTEGFGGSDGDRGVFYDRRGCLNTGVVATLLERVKATRSDILLRLIAALVNECCCMLLDGCVETVEDVNLLSIAALTLSPSTGGLLAYVDDHMGCLALLQSMKHMSGELGVTSPPSVLLQAMVEAGETFHTLSNETLFRVGQRV